MDRNEDVTRIKDLYAAAFLYTSKVRLTGTQRDSAGRVWFLFDGIEAPENHLHNFYAKKARVNAKAYADSLRSLKDLLFMDT